MSVLSKRPENPFLTVAFQSRLGYVSPSTSLPILVAKVATDLWAVGAVLRTQRRTRFGVGYRRPAARRSAATGISNLSTDCVARKTDGDETEPQSEDCETTKSTKAGMKRSEMTEIFGRHSGTSCNRQKFVLHCAHN